MVPYAVFGDPQSLNLYGYVRNDPVTRADADGHGGPLVFEIAASCVTDIWCFSSVAEGPEEASAQKNESTRATLEAQNQETPERLRDQIPTDIRAQMASAIDDSIAPTADDKRGKNHEESGVAGETSGGDWMVSRDKPGPVANPDVDAHAHTNPVPTDQKVANAIVDPMVFFHVHPSGKTATHSWNQPPSDIDKANTAPGKINIVFGAGDRKVYFYNSSGVIGKPMKLEDFLK